MPAPHPPHRLPRTRPAFTLTELLIVIALIALLVALLLAALNQVQKKSRETATLATMQAFSNACDTFQQEHGFYPGLVPEPILANDPKISGTENALLHLMGGGLRQEGSTTEEYDEFGGVEVTFDQPSGQPYRIKINRERMGDGPTIGGKAFAPYFAPSEKDFAIVRGQEPFGSDDDELPDLVDAWGQPIIYLRRQRAIGPLTDIQGSSVRPQFDMASMTPYTQAPGPIGRLGVDQNPTSILNTAGSPDALMYRLLEHPALPDQARGAYMLLSAGADGIYLSRVDGAGTPGTPVDDLVENDATWIEPYGHKTFEDYDDKLVFGGG
jgi:prepilin-type N-terminal cleavage/methylation domain-containing protein